MKKYNIINNSLGWLCFIIAAVTYLLTLEPTASFRDCPEWPPRDSSEILFGGEYVMLGDMVQPEDESNQELPAPSNEDVETVEADDLVDAGAQAQPSQVVTSTQESPMKVEPKPQPTTGPTKEELVATEKARIEKEKHEQIKNAFAGISKNTDANGKGKAGQADGNGKGKAGQTDENSEEGAISGAPGHSVSGRTLEYWEKTTRTRAGSIVVAVKVAPDGTVKSAKATGGSGAAYADPSVRSRCEQASLKCKFSVAKDETRNQTGTITWILK